MTPIRAPPKGATKRSTASRLSDTMNHSAPANTSPQLTSDVPPARRAAAVPMAVMAAA